jgi:HK97 family phage major capsid protein
MTYQELLELKNKRAMKLQEGQGFLAKKDLDAHKALMGEVAKMNAEIDAAEVQLAEEGRFDDKDEKLKGLHLSHKQQQEEQARIKAVDTIRSTNEYANAFAKALRIGMKVKKAWGVEEFAPLTKALQETGGAPEGADGGFLVPQDFDNMIHQMEKEYLDLSQFFNVEQVSTLTGWRAVESGTRKKLPKIAEMGTIGKDDQPKFAKISYSVSKYGDRLPVPCGGPPFPRYPPGAPAARPGRRSA